MVTATISPNCLKNWWHYRDPECPFIAKSQKKEVISQEKLGYCSWVVSLSWILFLPWDSSSFLVSMSKMVPWIIDLGNQATELFPLPEIKLWFPAPTSCGFQEEQILVPLYNKLVALTKFSGFEIQFFSLLKICWWWLVILLYNVWWNRNSNFP